MNDLNTFTQRTSAPRTRTPGQHHGPLPEDQTLRAQIAEANRRGLDTCLQSHFDLAELIGVGIDELDTLERAA